MATTASIRQMIDVWRDVLGDQEIAPDDDFFDLGGNSILAVRLIPLIEESFGAEATIMMLFDNPTPRSLAEAVTAAV